MIRVPGDFDEMLLKRLVTLLENLPVDARRPSAAQSVQASVAQIRCSLDEAPAESGNSGPRTSRIPPSSLRATVYFPLILFIPSNDNSQENIQPTVEYQPLLQEERCKVSKCRVRSRTMSFAPHTGPMFRRFRLNRGLHQLTP